MTTQDEAQMISLDALERIIGRLYLHNQGLLAENARLREMMNDPAQLLLDNAIARTQETVQASS